MVSVAGGGNGDAQGSVAFGTQYELLFFQGIWRARARESV